MTSISEALAARVDARITAELRESAGALDALDALALARGKYAVARDAWIAHFSRHLRAGEAREQLAAMDAHADDVRLALACLAGDAAALAELDARLRAVAPRALAGIRLGAVRLDDVLQDVREKLLVARGDDAPKLAQYSGRGPLDGWMRVTLARAAMSAVRVKDPAAAREDDDAPILEDAVADPQLEALRRMYAPALSRAVHEAVSALPDAERALLRMHLVDGLTIDDLAALYGAHRATMARRLAKVRSLVFEGARERATRALGIAEDEFASLMGLMLSRLDVTIRRAIDRA